MDKSDIFLCLAFGFLIIIVLSIMAYSLFKEHEIIYKCEDKCLQNKMEYYRMEGDENDICWCLSSTNEEIIMGKIK